MTRLTPELLRDTRRTATTPVASGHARLHLWFADVPSQAKVIRYLTQHGFVHQEADGNCILVDGEPERLRELAMPLRRIFTQFEADDLRVLFKPDGSELTTADFPNVHSFTRFSLVSQSSWLNDLLDGHRLTTVFQPIVMANDPGCVFAREALVRGIGRNAVVLFPNYMFDVARACGMMTQLDQAARASAVNALVRGELTERMFVNISTGTAHDTVEAVDTTLRTIDEAQVPHDRVVFEVTEADQTLDLGMLRRILGTYRDAGVRVALDDVGAGYSSLNLLHQLRPDYLKVDMELIRGVHADPYKALIAEKILEIARSLNIETIAEGIEAPEELAWIQAHGADYAQGYLIAKPSEPVFR